MAANTANKKKTPKTLILFHDPEWRTTTKMSQQALWSSSKCQKPFHVFRSNNLIECECVQQDDRVQVEWNSLSSLPQCVWQRRILYVANAVEVINYSQGIYLTMPGVQILSGRFETSSLHTLSHVELRNKNERKNDREKAFLKFYTERLETLTGILERSWSFYLE